LPCYLTWAGEEVKEIILRHLKESALYGGAISGRGPRYCPSVEDKIVKFPDAARHQVFLEPEGLDTAEMYVNGLSTSLPPEVQLDFLRHVPGLQQVKMTRAGYAIEYDYFPPTQLRPTLEVRQIDGLFLAGQVNGTTGYEEAAGQGIVAGINAAAIALEAEPLVLGRGDAFIGVLIDDLISRGVDEPYRLFTSRAEYRLLLRQDNALRRLLPTAERLGLLNPTEQSTASRRLEEEDQVRDFALRTSLSVEQANEFLDPSENLVQQTVRIAELIRRPGTELAPMMSACGFEAAPSAIAWAETELKYEGYIVRERANIRKLEKLDTFRLPEELPYRTFQSISYEGREKLDRLKPPTLGLASRIPGISPSDLQGLVLEVLRWKAEI
jgi:tRNA uridine 5-carboxymethylaminomethyl modification enzyme